MSGVNGNFEFSRYDQGQNIGGELDGTEKAGDGKLTGAEAVKARSDGWTVWDGFSEKDTGSVQCEQEPLKRLISTFLNMQKTDSYKQYMRRVAEIVNEKYGFNVISITEEGATMFSADSFIDEDFPTVMENARKQAKKEMGLSNNTFGLGIKFKQTDSVSDDQPTDSVSDDQPTGLTPANDYTWIHSAEKKLDYNKLELDLKALLLVRNIDESKTETKVDKYGYTTIIKYDSEGRMVYEKSTSYSGSCESYYDVNGNKTCFVARDSDGNIESVKKSIYDKNGYRLSTTSYNKDGNAVYTDAYSLSGMYDENGNIKYYCSYEFDDKDGCKTTYCNSKNEALFYCESRFGDEGMENKYYLMDGHEITKEYAEILLGDSLY